jgi:hypothetical protein
MFLSNKEMEKVMLESIIHKHGLMLNSKECAKETRAKKSNRGLDEDRKEGKNIPEYIQKGKAILYPVQNVVNYHLEVSTQSIKTMK